MNKCLKVLLVVFLLGLGINAVRAADKVLVESFTETGNFVDSNGCSNAKTICSYTYGAGISEDVTDGIRVTVKKLKDNSVVKSKDLWFNTDKLKDATSKYELNTGEIFNSTQYDQTERAKNASSIDEVYNSYLNYKGDNNAYYYDVFRYADFLQDFLSKNQNKSYVKIILKKLGYNNITEATEYYLLIEPIFKLKYKFSDKWNYYFVGTAREIVEEMLNHRYVSNPYTHEDRLKYAKYFVYKDHNNPDDPDDYCTTMAGVVSGSCGNWNVLRNYLYTFKVPSAVAEKYGLDKIKNM